MNLLTGKTAVVTGAAAGIGEEIARLFSDEGATVLMLDRDGSELEVACRKIDGAVAFPVDLSDASQTRSTFEKALTQYQIDILVNNAGIYPRKSFQEISEHDWDTMFDVNLKSMYRTIQLVLPGMIARRSGWIVNIASIVALIGACQLTHYGAAKGGVIGFTRSLARETGEFDIHVNCVTPGAIYTEREKQFHTPESARAMVEQQCFQRRILPIDVARACLFLSSELCSGMTGQTVNVDGGWTMI